MTTIYGAVIFEPASEPDIDIDSDFRMLVAIPSPRDIPEFLQSVQDCLKSYDKIWFKYFHLQADPYRLIQKYFLRKRPKRRYYTHLAILPDDLVINKKGVNRLVNNVKNNPAKYKVMMGTCSVTYGSKKLALCDNLPSIDLERRVYRWYSKSKIDSSRGGKKGIISVMHCGTPFAILSRDVMEKIKLGNSLNDNNNSNEIQAPVDVLISHQLNVLGIKLWVDTRVFFVHLKGLPIAEV